jgi:hypothetical protein
MASVADAVTGEVDECQLQARPTGQVLALHHSGLDYGPRAVANRRDGLAGFGKHLDEGDGIPIEPELVGVGGAARQHQPGVVVDGGIGDLEIGLKGVGEFQVVAVLAVLPREVG